MSSQEVTVYSKPSCVQCTATKRFLDDHDIPFIDGDAVENVEHIRALLPFVQAPIVKVVDTKLGTATFWYGHNPDHLNKLLTP